MANKSEILFVDPLITDPNTLLKHLRSEVEAIVLNPDKQAVRQMAAALAGREGLNAVHVVAHGAPGRVSFAAGDWSAETLEEAANEFSAIGRALAADGNLRLWSCHAGARAVGASFVAGLANAAGADIAAAITGVGQTGVGGSWKLVAGPSAGAPEPPLTVAGMARYAGVLAVEITVTGTLPNGDTTNTVTYFIVDKARGTIVSQVVLPDAVKQNNSVSITVKVPSLSGSFEIGTFDDAGNFLPSSFLSVNRPDTTGAVGE